MKSSLLDVRNLKVQKKGTLLLDGISLSLKTHEIMSLVGPSGNNGELLLKTLANHDRDRDVSGELIWAEECRVGYVSRSMGALEDISIFDNLQLVLKMIGFRSHTHSGEAVEKVLKQVNLWSELKSRLHEPFSEVPSFQKVKINLARSLLFKPQVLFLEDPTQFLDPVQIVEYENIIEKLKAKMSTIWLTSDLEQAARVSDTIGIISGGRLLEFGQTKDIFTMPKNPETEQFITRRIYV